MATHSTSLRCCREYVDRRRSLCFSVCASRAGLTPSPTCPSLGKVASAKAGCGRSGNQTGTPLVSPPRCEPMEGFYMSANIIRLLPDEERALLECYVAGSQHPASFRQPSRQQAPHASPAQSGVHASAAAVFPPARQEGN